MTTPEASLDPGRRRGVEAVAVACVGTRGYTSPHKSYFGISLRRPRPASSVGRLLLQIAFIVPSHWNVAYGSEPDYASTARF